MKNDNEKAEILIEALPYIKKYINEIIVVKYGGNAMLNNELKQSVMKDLILLTTIGIKVVLVHGGGPEISQMLKKIGKESVFIDGLRVTDDETMDIVQMILAGKANKDLVNILESNGGKAIGLSGIDGHMLIAQKLEEKYGQVGDITNINTKIILDALALGYIPVISTIACDDNANVYNINADTAASAIAGALKAKSLIAMTDVKGLLKDKDDESTLIPYVRISDVKALIKEGIISGGMIPKINCCVDAVRQGVDRAFIIDGRIPHAILIEVLSDSGIGTMFVNV
ncbi:MAG: acetylglutamate kinase [Fusobacteriaceae bacterium]|jgi:acetylglutamate kinase|nr:acetylglutamate kinase [Fusobacteriaceae bacterium]